MVLASSPSLPEIISAWFVEESTFLMELYTTFPRRTSAFSLLAFKEDRYFTGSLISQITKESTVITFLSFVVTSLGYRSEIILYLGILWTDCKNGILKEGPAVSSTRTTFPNWIIREYSLALVTTRGLQIKLTKRTTMTIAAFFIDLTIDFIAGHLPVPGC